MKPWQLFILGVVPLAIAGCRTDSATRSAWEREDRLREDRIYQLQDRVCELEDSLQTCQDQLRRAKSDDDGEPRRKHGSAGSSGGHPPEIELPSQPTSRTPDALKHPGGSVPSDIPDVPPDIQGPSPGGSSNDGPSLDRDSEGPSARPVGISEAVPFRPSGNSRRVTSIALDPTLTSGIGSNDGSGDKGLLVVVQPRGGDGRTVDAPAKMNVAVFDPAFEGDAARLARWDFTAAETASLFRRGESGAAIHLAMGWPNHPPKHKNLQLYVRYITADGRQLVTNQPIEVALPGERTARWTPAARRSQDRDPDAASWRPNESPIARHDDEPLRMATRPADSLPDRPIWSPERR